MKEFILKTVCFLLPIILVGICMEVVLRCIPNDYKYKKEYLDKHSDEIETLILGSSHSFYGIDPRCFSSKAFNASHLSQTLNYDIEIYRKYQNDFTNLKTVILPISYFTLWAKLEDGNESWRVKNYSLYYKIKTSGSFINNTELFGNIFKMNVKRLYLYYLKKQQSISCSELGWGTAYKSEDSQDLVQSGKIAAKRHSIDNINSSEQSRIFDENITILSTLIESCHQRNIRLIFVTLPVYKTYRDNLDVEQNTKTIQTIADLAHKNKYEYLNLIEDSSFIAKDFYDADHLNELGAKKLSLFLKEKMGL